VKFLYFPVYYFGRSGLSNCLMSLECGIGLAHLMNRILLIDERVSPSANVVNHGKKVSNSNLPMLTDLYDIPVNWKYAKDIPNLDSVDIIKKNNSLSNKVYCSSKNVNVLSDKFKDFSRGRSVITYSDNLKEVPLIKVDTDQTLSFYSHFFYIEDKREDFIRTMLSIKPKKVYRDYVKFIVNKIGNFDAVHIRMGDLLSKPHKYNEKGLPFPKDYWDPNFTSMRYRTEEDIIKVFDKFFTKDKPILISSDGFKTSSVNFPHRQSIFTKIKNEYSNVIFINDLILNDKDNYEYFKELPYSSSILIAMLSQLICSKSDIFIGTMLSTFTGIIQRYRQKDFKFLWDEIPPTRGPWNKQKTKIDVSYRFKNCEMVETNEGYFSWNRVNYNHINPAWMREWKESFEW